MRVLFMRHGAAVEPFRAEGDPYRWLTRSGRETAAHVGSLLAGEGVVLTNVVTSPLVRAVQTAELVAHASGFAGEIEVIAALAPTSGLRAQALRPLDTSPADAVVLMVGHEPSIRSLASSVVGADLPGFRTGSVCGADVDEGQVGRFAFFLDPTRGVFARNPSEIGA